MSEVDCLRDPVRGAGRARREAGDGADSDFQKATLDGDVDVRP
jgi:hypothetical protein